MNFRNLFVITTILVVIVSANVFAQEPSSTYNEGKLYVKVNSSYSHVITEYDNTDNSDFYSPISGLNDLANTSGIYKIEKTFKLVSSGSNQLGDIYTIYFENIIYDDSLINLLQNDSLIEYVERIPIYRFTTSPTDAAYQSGNQWGLANIHAEQAWDLTKGSQNVKVAIVDDAVLLNHEDLRYKIWVNQDEIPPALKAAILNSQSIPSGIIDVAALLTYFGLTNIDDLFNTSLFNYQDDDGNTYVDDILGWDATLNMDRNPNPPVTATNTYFSHGTHVAGIVAAQTTESGTGNGVASIGWNVSIIPVKCQNDNTTGNTADAVLKGTEYAIDAGADVINMSWGGTVYCQTLQNLINEAHSKGIIMVAASGNEGLDPIEADMMHYPAAHDHVISVGASDNLDKRADFSCYSNDTIKWVDVMAPGDDIYSCLPGSTSSYGYKDGTSMASPLVAGLCGLMQSYCPSCTPDQIADCLFSTCDPMPNEPHYNSNFNDSYVGHGRVNAYSAVQCLESYSTVASFSTEFGSVCAGTNTMGLIDESTGFITSWEWSSPNSSVSFSSTTDQNPEFTVIGSVGDSYTITLVVFNDSVNISDTITNVYAITQPEANIIYPDTNAVSCNNNSNYFIVEFVNANPPFDFTYSDNLGNNYSVSGVTSNPYLINVFPENDNTTTYTLTSISSYDGCSGTASDNISFTSSPCNCFSPLPNNNWNFGEEAGLQFEATILNPTSGAYTTTGFDSHEGTASISDTEGNLLFYGAGWYIYDKSFNVMENGDQIKGDNSSSQGMIILPKSELDSTYYLISVEAVERFSWGPVTESIWYNVIDMKEQGTNWQPATAPNGKVIDKNIPLPVNNNHVSEKLTWVRHGNISNNYWVITHSHFDNTFHVYLASPDTIVYHHSNSVGTNLVGTPGAGVLKANLQRTMLSAAYSHYNTIDLFSFNDLTGEIGFLENIQSNYAYPLEFSPSGGFLYVGKGSSYVDRYVVNPSPNLANPNYLTLSDNFGPYPGVIGMQLSPDHTKIYFGDSDSIQAFNTPDLVDPSYDSCAFNLVNGTEAVLTLPQLMPSSQTSMSLVSMTNDCSGTCSGSATVIAWSDCPPVTYQWDDPSYQTGATVTGLCAGIYTVMAVDACGCASSLEVTIEESILDITNIANDPGCPYMYNASIDITVESTAPPVTYLWSNGATMQDIINLAPGYYTFTISDSIGCEIMDSIYTGDQLELSASVQTVSCNGLADGAIDLTVTGGTLPYSYLWWTGEQTEDLFGLAAGQYAVTVTDFNQCQQYLVVDVPQPPSPRYILNYDETVCNCSGMAYASEPLFYGFEWSTGSTNDTILGLCPDTYYITVTDLSSGCVFVETFTIDSIPLHVQGVSTLNASCPNSDGSAWIETDTILYGNPGYTYEWFSLIGSSGVLSTSDSISGLFPSPYEVIVTDTNGCIDTAQFIIGHYDPDSITVFTTNNTCPQTSNGSAYFVDSLLGINTGVWLNTWSTSNMGQDSITNLSTGTYFLQVVDSNQCHALTFFEIENDYVLEIDTIHALAEFCDDACNGEIQIDMLNGTPGFEYVLEMDTALSGSSLYSFNNLCPGAYNVTVTDLMGCTTNAGPIEIEEFNYDITWTITADDCISPTDYLIEIEATGDFLPPLTYALDGGIASDSIHVPTHGTYILSITDANNCTVYDTIIVEPAFDVYIELITVNPTCEVPYNGSILVDSLVGIPPFSFNWSNGSNTNPNENLAPGQYFVTVTDAYGCQHTDSSTVDGDNIAQLSWEVIPPVCMDSASGAIDVEIDQGDIYYTYEWTENGIPGFSNKEDIDSLITGYIYSLTATGTVDGCVLTLTDTIPEEADLGITLLMSGGSCNNIKDSLGYLADGEIEVVVYGGSGNFNYSWEMDGSPTSYTTANIDSLESGAIMSVTVTDQNSTCSGSATDTIRWKQKIDLSAGWGIMSTYISPAGSSPVKVYFEDQNVANDMSIMKSGSGLVYWPLWNLNTIGNFAADEGYQIKMHTDQVFELSGQLNCPEDYPMVHNAGWRIWPYLRLNAMNVTTALNSIVQPTQVVEIMKSGSGGVFWPLFNQNSIGNLIPGEGYQIKLNDAVTFYYPDNDTTFLTKCGSENIVDVYEHYLNLYINTDNFMILGIPVDAWDEIPALGDEIAAIGEYGQIAGKAIFKGGFTAIVIYGDDYYTPGVIEGLSTDEQFTLEIWNGTNKSLKQFQIKSWFKGDGFFSNEKISVAGASEVEADEEDAPFIVHVYPNPSNGHYKLEVISTIKTEVELTIFNQNGQLVNSMDELAINKGFNSFHIDIHENVSGNYYLNLSGKEYKAHVQLMLIK